MSIGIEFTLKASTAAFTRALATVDNATSKLQKSLAGKFEGRDLARGLTTALGLSVDKIADKFARLWTGMSEQAEEAYKKSGELSDELVQKTYEAGKARLTDEQKYQLALKESADLQKRIAENLGKTTEDQNRSMQDQLKLLEKQRDAAEAKAKIEKDAAEKTEKDLKHRKEVTDLAEGASERLHKQIAEERQDRMDKAKEEDRAHNDLMGKFAPSVEQLAQMGTGGFTAQDDPRIIARKIIEKEKFASEAGSRGDITGALNMGREARSMRESIQFQTGSGTALTAETAETALRNALDTTNKELAEVKTALAGIIKAQ